MGQTSERLLRAITSPDALALTTPMPLHGRGLTTAGDFVVEEGDSVPSCCDGTHRTGRSPRRGTRGGCVEATRRWWREWAARCTHDRQPRDAVARSLITLKGLTFAPTGGVIAAPTTSLPEALGGVLQRDSRRRDG